MRFIDDGSFTKYKGHIFDPFYTNIVILKNTAVNYWSGLFYKTSFKLPNMVYAKKVIVYIKETEDIEGIQV